MSIQLRSHIARTFNPGISEINFHEISDVESRPATENLSNNYFKSHVGTTPLGSEHLNLSNIFDADSGVRLPTDRLKLSKNRSELRSEVIKRSMHLSTVQRAKIYQDINRLLEDSDWDCDGELVDKDSFVSFLRFVIFSPQAKLPSVALSNNGDIVVQWYKGVQKVTVQFKENDRCIMVTEKNTERNTVDRSAISTTVPFILSYIDAQGLDVYK